MASFPLEVRCRACGYEFGYSLKDVEMVEDVLYGNIWKSIKCKNSSPQCKNIIVLDTEPYSGKCCVLI